MRTKMIGGNLVAVLLVGVVSYFLVSSKIASNFVEEVDSQIAGRAALFDQTWRLSGEELVGQAVEQAAADDTEDVFTALDETAQRQRAYDRATAVLDWFARRNRNRIGPPEVVVITDDRGMVIARSQDRNRMHGNDLTRQLTTLAGAMERGTAAVDVWTFEEGGIKLLQTAIAPIRDNDGRVRGALIVGYELSNGMASRVGELLGCDVAFVHNEAVYASSLQGGDALRAAVFQGNEAAVSGALESGNLSDRFRAQVGEAEYVAVIGPLSDSPSTAVGFAVLGNRSAQRDKASPVNMILLMTALGVLVVILYGFLLGNSFIKPIEQMEEGVLAVINGRTDLRLDIQSAELGGLAYRLNQLLNVFTGTPEEDEDGRVSSPPGAWAAATAEEMATVPSGSEKPSASGEEDDPDLAAKLAAEPEAEYYHRIFEEYVEAKRAAGENVSSITEDRFVQRLQANEKSLIAKHQCRMVRFQVQVRGAQINLRPVIIR